MMYKINNHFYSLTPQAIRYIHSRERIPTSMDVPSDFTNGISIRDEDKQRFTEEEVIAIQSVHTRDMTEEELQRFHSKERPSITKQCQFTELRQTSTIVKYQRKKVSKLIEAMIWIDVERTYERVNDEIVCPICRKYVLRDEDYGWEVGHVIAVSNGGTNDISNLRAICRRCNGRMRTIHMADYIRQEVRDVKEADELIAKLHLNR